MKISLLDKITLLLSFTALTALLFVLPVQAAPSDFTFEATPLFNEANFLPGDTVTRSVYVNNTTGQAQAVGVKTTFFNDADNLGSTLYLTIKEGDSSLYQGYLAAFFAAGELPLSNVGVGANTAYSFSIVMDDLTGNEFQLKNLSFDFSLGYIIDGAVTITARSSSGTYFSSSNSGNNSAPQTGSVLGNALKPALIVSKIVEKDKVYAGQKSLSYTVTITNNGGASAFDVALADTLPAGLFFIDGQTAKNWIIGELASGKSTQIDYLVDVASTLPSGSYENQAQVSASNHAPLFATAMLTVQRPVVLGEKLSATGFEFGDFIYLLALVTVAFTFFYSLRQKNL